MQRKGNNSKIFSTPPKTPTAKCHILRYVHKQRQSSPSFLSSSLLPPPSSFTSIYLQSPPTFKPHHIQMYHPFFFFFFLVFSCWRERKKKKKTPPQTPPHHKFTQQNVSKAAIPFFRITILPCPRPNKHQGKRKRGKEIERKKKTRKTPF